MRDESLYPWWAFCLPIYGNLFFLKQKKNIVKKYSLVFFLMIFIIPVFTFASWWNPASWFKKQTVQSPVVQIPAPTPTSINDKQIKREKVIQKKEKPSIKPIQKQITPITSTHSNGGGGNGGGVIVVCPIVGSCPSTSSVPINNSIPPVMVPVVSNTNTTSITSPSVVAIDTFLTDPTAENFKTFCTTAKTLPGMGEKKVLNDTRTDYVMRKNTLYDEVEECAMALGEHKTNSGELVSISWLTYNPSDLFEFDNPNESDSIREIKINYNTYWKSLSAYKLIGFEYSLGNEIITPKQGIENAITADNSVGLLIYRLAMKQAKLFIVPEQILSNLRMRLITN